MFGIIRKLLNIPIAFRIKLYPILNRVLLKHYGAELGDNIVITGKLNLLVDRANNKIKIGNNFYFSSGDSVNPIASNLQGAIYLENGAILNIGNNVGMSSTRMWIHDSITIGNNVKIGACVLITDTDVHPINYIKRRTLNNGVKSAPIVIEDDAWIGAHCVILKGVTIGARSIIGAGSVITKNIPADCIAAGNPCKPIKKLS